MFVSKYRHRSDLTTIFLIVDIVSNTNLVRSPNNTIPSQSDHTVDAAGDEEMRIVHVGLPPGGERGRLQLARSGQAAGERLDL